MIITLISPLQRKWCLWEYLHGLRILFEANPEVTFRWIIHDNSRNKRFHKVIASEARQIQKTHKNIDRLIHHINDTNYADTDAKDRGNVGDIMIRIYNIAFGLANWDSDYGMIVEDDVLVTQVDALSLMLKAMDEKTGTVSGSSFARYVLAHAENPKVVTQHWEFKDHKTRGGTSRLATQINPLAAGVSEVEMTAQSFWLSRFDLIKRLGFATHPKIGGADRAWCLRIADEGFKTKVVWDIKARHYYKTADGRMDYVNYNKAHIALNPTKRRMIRVQTGRKSSPEFTEVVCNV